MPEVIRSTCNMGARDLPDMYALGLRACISGKSLVPVLQLLHVPLYKHLGKADDTVETTPEHKRSNSEKVLPEDNSLGNGQ